MSEILALNENEAKKIKAECRNAMQSQIDNMEGTIKKNVDAINKLDAEASRQEYIATNATKDEIRHRYDGSTYIEKVPDLNARATAAAIAKELRRQIEELRKMIYELRVESNRLGNEIIKTEKMIDDLLAKAQKTDLNFARKLEEVMNEILRFNTKMDQIYNSFDDVSLTFSSFMLGLSGIGSSGDILTTLPVSGIGYYQLPQSGAGYIAYGSVDIRWGTPETVTSILALGEAWSKKGYGNLSIGNISNPNGGPISASRSHQTGVDYDIRPIRNDGKTAPLNIIDNPNDYSLEKTRELVETIIATGNVDVIFFNDPTLISEFDEVKYWSGHNDHLHVRYK